MLLRQVRGHPFAQWREAFAGGVLKGFARRLATYKRLHLLAQDPERAARIMNGPHPVQLLVAGKHP